jgi:hypothetical protein
MKRQIENFSKILISCRDVHTYRLSVLSCFKSKLDRRNMHPSAGEKTPCFNSCDHQQKLLLRKIGIY